MYPIKVNQQRRVVHEILRAREEGEPVGLEAGSKPELLAVLALSNPGDVVVCNGYKDREYLRLALMGEKLGFQVQIVTGSAGRHAGREGERGADGLARSAVRAVAHVRVHLQPQVVDARPADQSPSTDTGRAAVWICLAPEPCRRLKAENSGGGGLPSSWAIEA